MPCTLRVGLHTLHVPLETLKLIRWRKPQIKWACFPPVLHLKKTTSVARKRPFSGWTPGIKATANEPKLTHTCWSGPTYTTNSHDNASLAPPLLMHVSIFWHNDQQPGGALLSLIYTRHNRNGSGDPALSSPAAAASLARLGSVDCWLSSLFSRFWSL